MAEVDTRQILVAFHEQGWALYEYVGCSYVWAENLRGPVDNLVDGVEYTIMPDTGSPANTHAAVSAWKRLEKAGMLPDYVHEDGEIIPMPKIMFSARMGVLRLSPGNNFMRGGEDLPFVYIPLEEAVERIRHGMAEYDKRGANEIIDIIGDPELD